MLINKTMIMFLALEGLKKKYFAEEYFFITTKFEHLRYSITKDCPDWLRRDINKAIKDMTKILEMAHNVSEAPMNTVTRKSRYWDK